MENIVFDIDDVIVSETGFLRENAPKFLKKYYNLSVEIKNTNGYKVSETYGLREIFSKNNDLIEEQIEKKCKEIDSKFWTRNFLKYMFYPLKKDVRETINNLKEKGYRVYFVSTRGKKTKEKEKVIDKFIRQKIVPFLTKSQLNMNLIKYNQVKLVQNEEEKIEFIKDIKAKFLFDDQLSILEKVPENTIPVCVESNHNKNKILNQRILRVTSFENEEVKKLVLDNCKCKKKSKNKYGNVKVYEKIYTESFYVLVRTVFKNLFVKKFKPIVCGLENIPDDKRAVVYVGNHRNDLDPLIVTLFAKNPTHWAALLRLFQAKENLFGRDDIAVLRNLSAFLIKSMGSIPIARKTDDNYSDININSLLKIESYIKLNSCIGFYPEGTKNRKPEEQNILPLASDAIFSIVKHNRAWVQPFSIVWTPKDINIPNKVVLIFPKAIEATGMSTSEIKQQWYNSVNSEIERTKELFEQLRKIQLENSDDITREQQKQLVIKKFAVKK